MRLEGQGGDRMLQQKLAHRRGMDAWGGVGAEVRIVYFVNGLTYQDIIEDILAA